MRDRAGRIIFKIMMPNDGPRMLRDHPHTGHARITIGIDEIDLAAKKDVLIIRAAGRKD